MIPGITLWPWHNREWFWESLSGLDSVDGDSYNPPLAPNMAEGYSWNIALTTNKAKGDSRDHALALTGEQVIL